MSLSSCLFIFCVLFFSHFFFFLPLSLFALDHNLMFFYYVPSLYYFLFFNFIKTTYTSERLSKNNIIWIEDRDVQVSAKNKRNEIKQDSCEERIYSIIFFLKCYMKAYVDDSIFHRRERNKKMKQRMI